MKVILQIVVQVLVLAGLSLLGDEITRLSHIQIPGSILGFFVLFVLLQFKVIQVEWLEKGANLLLSEMLLFFVPSAVGVINYLGLLRADGLKLVLVIALSSICVMLVSGKTTELWSRRKGKTAHD